MTLNAVKQAAEARRTAEANYRSAVLAAVAEHGPTVTAEAAGVTRQAVRQLVARARAGVDEIARLEELDASCDRAVETLAGAGVDEIARDITALRNARARKEKRPTLKAEALTRAETRLLEMLEAGLTAEGFTPADLEEASRLRQQAEDTPLPF